METITGIVEHVVYQNSETGYAVIELSVNDEYVTAVGPLSGITEGEEITASGEYVNHASFGVQFKVSNCEYRLPETEGAILKYLSSGALSGIGPIIARRIVDEFGSDTFNVISNSPGRLAGIKGLNGGKAMKISQEFKRIFGIREAVSFLATLGVTAACAIEAYRHFGELTVQLVGENPYILCSYPLYLPFEQIDRLASDMQMDKHSFARISAGILYILRHNLNNGHSCIPENKLKQTAQRFLDVELDALEIVMLKLVDVGDIFCIEQYPQPNIYFLPEYFRAEMYIANSIKSLMGKQLEEIDYVENKIMRLEASVSIKYAPMQRKAIVSALTSNAMVLTGGPGTGKTTTVNAIISLLEQSFTEIALTAPTGRAAKRLAELTGRKATTIHRLLEVDYRTQGDEIRFIHNHANLLKHDVVIIDEMSMVDTLLFESLLLALKPTCRLILVGDIDQLPSVGAGNVLKEIIDSDIMPVIRLDTIFRQSAESLIISNAHNIVKGILPQKGTKLDDFFMLEASAQASQDLVVDLICNRLPTSYNLSPISDIQVLCPSKIGTTGTIALNALLQARLNPASKEKGEITWMGQCYRCGDKVMQIKNNYDIQYKRDDGEMGAGAFNGDIGIIENVNTRAAEITVRFDDKVYVYTTEFIRQLELAYAVTIHKSQGSEFSAVVIPVSDVPQRLQYRNLLYTGVTRAKRLLVMVGQSGIVQNMCQNSKSILRYSCLAQFINDADTSF